MTEGNGEVRELPKGWALTTVREAIKIIDYRGRTPPFSENGIPHLRSSNIRNRKIVWEDLRYISEETHQTYMTRGLPEKGDVLFTTEAPLGEVALAPEQRFSLAQRMMILRPNKSLLLSKFLLYQIENEDFQRKLTKSGTGTTVTGVSSRNFQPTPIILAPINEQERIVEKIEELFSDVDQGIESLKTAQKQLKVYRQAVLKWAFEGKLTEAGRQQQTDVSPVILNAAQRSEESQTNANDRDSSLRVHSAQNDTRRLTGEALLAQIKAERENRYQQQLAEWEEKVREWEAIGKVGKKPTKPSKPKELQPLTESEISKLSTLPNSWAWVRIGNITECLDSMRIPINKKEREKRHGNIPYYGANGQVGWIDNYLFDEPLILIVEDETFTGREKPFSYKILGKSWVNNHAHILRSETILDIDYLNYQLSYYPFTALTTGTTGRKKLTQEALINAPVKLCPVEEQGEIVQELESRLSTCDRLEATIIENLQKAEALRQSILKQAFEGKLVPQDPNDEPAEQLLERIKQEKANPSKDN